MIGEPPNTIAAAFGLRGRCRSPMVTRRADAVDGNKTSISRKQTARMRPAKNRFMWNSPFTPFQRKRALRRDFLLSIDVPAVQNPAALTTLRIVMGEMDQATLSAPDVLSAQRHRIPNSFRDPLANTRVVDDQNRLPTRTGDVEALMAISALLVGKKSRDHRRSRDPHIRMVSPEEALRLPTAGSLCRSLLSDGRAGALVHAKKYDRSHQNDRARCNENSCRKAHRVKVNIGISLSGAGASRLQTYCRPQRWDADTPDSK